MAKYTTKELRGKNVAVSDELGGIEAENGIVYWLDFCGLSIPARRINAVRLAISAILEKANEVQK